MYFNPLTSNDHHSGRTASLTSKRCIIYIYIYIYIYIHIYIQQIQVLNILNMVYTLRVFLFKIQFFHNSNVFGSCIIHILYTGCAKIKKINSGAKKLIGAAWYHVAYYFVKFLLWFRFADCLPGCNSRWWWSDVEPRRVAENITPPPPAAP